MSMREKFVTRFIYEIKTDMAIYREYPHYPPHLFKPEAIYLITGSTVRKQPYLDTDEKKDFFCKTLFKQASRLNWKLEAWACMTNHYHFVAQAPQNVETMTTLIRSIHSLSARKINEIDNQSGRRVWWNYWDTCIRNEQEYLSMLKYVHENPIKHHLEMKPEDYSFCSYRWFMAMSETDFRQKILSRS